MFFKRNVNFPSDLMPESSFNPADSYNPASDFGYVKEKETKENAKSGLFTGDCKEIANSDLLRFASRI